MVFSNIGPAVDELNQPDTHVPDGSDKGVIPLVTEELFNRITQKTKTDPAVEFRVEVSYMEIYNEKGLSDACCCRDPRNSTLLTPLNSS